MTVLLRAGAINEVLMSDSILVKCVPGQQELVALVSRVLLADHLGKLVSVAAHVLGRLVDHVPQARRRERPAHGVGCVCVRDASVF